MKRRALLVFTILLLTPLTLGFYVQGCHGGLNSWDFEQVALNGLDPEDNARDRNHYAWAMRYYDAPEAEGGHLYLGTGNNIAGLIGYQVEQIVAGEELVDPPVFPPEIRRYRPDLGPQKWETVLDYRDVEEEGEFATIGFRFLMPYTNPQGATHLYAATFGEDAALWRSASGDPGTWEVAWQLGAIGSVRWMEAHDGLLYLAIANDIPGQEKIGRLWASDGVDFWPVVTDGFGNPDNAEIECLQSFNGWLYVGTSNITTGYEIWKMAGPVGAVEDPVRVVANGGPDPDNEIAGTPCVFKGALYMGSLMFIGGVNPESGRAFKGFDIIRIHPDDSWETVVGPDSLSGYDSGFNHFTNAYNWWMEEHDGWLYASSLDNSTLLADGLRNLDTVIEFFQDAQGALKRRPKPLDRALHAGADIFKTCDGVNWAPVTLGGLGDPANYGFRTMESVGDTLFLGTANPFDGLEIWAAQSKPSQ